MVRNYDRILPPGCPVVYEDPEPGPAEIAAANLALPAYVRAAAQDITQLAARNNFLAVAAALEEADHYLNLILDRTAAIGVTLTPSPEWRLLAQQSRQRAIADFAAIMERYGPQASAAYASESDPYNSPAVHFFTATASVINQHAVAMFHAHHCAADDVWLLPGHQRCAKSSWYAIQARMPELGDPPSRQTPGRHSHNLERRVRSLAAGRQAIAAVEAVQVKFRQTMAGI